MTTALVIGGGIGGPVAALALQKAGIEPTIYEGRDATVESAGWFLSLASNGLDALRAVDVDIAARCDGFPIPKLVLWTGKGRRLGTVSNGVKLADGTVSTCVKRGALHAVLRDEVARRGIAMHYGQALVGLEVDREQVIAHLADGSSDSADLLVGADGIHSQVRRSIEPDAPQPSYTGQLSVGGYSTMPGLAPTTGTQHLVFGRKAFFGYLIREDGETYWFANVAAPHHTLGERLACDVETWKRHLTELFSADMALIGAIIGASHEVGARPIHDIPTARSWARGPVVLIGDALHATSPSAGQGASLACEDAVMLAMCLRDHRGPSEAFDAFERLRRERVERVVAYARKRGNNKIAGPLSRRLRDLLLPTILRRTANDEAHAWMYRYHIDWSSPASGVPSPTL